MNQRQNILSNGWAIVRRNKQYVIWFYLLNLALAWMGARTFRQQAGHVLDHSLYSNGLVQGFDLGVFTEMLARPEFGPVRATTVPAMGLAVIFMLITMIFVPGVFLGYASDHRISREEFFRSCGENLWRFVRLMILFGIVGGMVAGVLFGIQHVLIEAASASSNETLSLSFYVQLACLTVIFVIMTAIRIWFDLAETDVVLADQNAVRKSLGMALRQIRQNPARLLGAYVAVSVAGATILTAGIWLWYTIVPPASVLGAFLVSQATLFLLLAMRFWQRATAVAFYTGSKLEQAITIPVAASQPFPSPSAAQPAGM